MITWFSIQYKFAPILNNEPISKIIHVTLETPFDEPREIQIPKKISVDYPGTPITISAKITPGLKDSLLVKTVFSPMEIYINNELVHSSGEGGSYPSYMNDPPTSLALLRLPYDTGELDIRINYLSLTQRPVLSLPVILMGSESTLLSSQVSAHGFSLLFSLVLIFIGLIMILISFTIVYKVTSGKSLLWLGLFSLSAGIWIFGECDLSALLFPYPSLLYSMAYLGLFTFTIPLIQFVLVMLEPKNRLPYNTMLWIHYFTLSLAIILQLLGIVDFIKSLYWFHIITPLSFVGVTLCLIIEYFKYKNPAAKRFAPAIILLAASTVVELLNYWLNITNILTMFFQLGVLSFVISLGIASEYYVKETVFTASEKKRLEYEMTSMGHNLQLQRQQYMRIAENEAQIKAQSHDLRHQLRILRELNNEKKHMELDRYLNTIIDNIPSNKDIKICENYAINAIVAYYITIAQKEDIDISINLSIPMELDSNLESDLSVILGNLLENAVDACRLVKKSERFVRLKSQIKYNILTITVDNSFHGSLKQQNGVFLSSKRDGEGIGISSIMAVANKYQGSAKFEAKDGVFQSSLYIKIL